MGLIKQVGFSLITCLVMASCSIDDEKGQADLVPDDAQFISSGGTVTAVEIRVTNRGDADANACSIRISVNGLTIAVADVDSIEANRSRIISIPVVLGSGLQQVQILVDSAGAVDESNESNNVYLLTTTVSS